MAKKNKYNMIALADLVRESIDNKTLSKDYDTLLESCRSLGIPSYALDRIIRLELQRKDTADVVELNPALFVKVNRGSVDASDIGLRSEAKRGDSSGKAKNKKRVNSDEEKVSDLETLNKNTSDIPSEQPDTIHSPKGKKKGCWIKMLIMLCVVGLLGATSYFYNQAENYRREAVRERSNANGIMSVLQNASPSTLNDWTSSNHTHSSRSEGQQTFFAYKGDILTAEVNCDSENYDQMIVELVKMSDRNKGSIDALANLSGRYQTKSVEFVIPETGFYTLQYRYTKDSSIHEGADMGSIRNIHIEQKYLNTILY